MQNFKENPTDIYGESEGEHPSIKVSEQSFDPLRFEGLGVRNKLTG